MKKSFIILAVAMIGLAADAHADNPVCPCWEGVVGLDHIVSEFRSSPRICTTTPQLDNRFQTLSAFMHAEGAGVQTFFIFSNGPHSTLGTSACEVVNRGIFHVIVRDLSQPEAWTCIQDITVICRELGF